MWHIFVLDSYELNMYSCVNWFQVVWYCDNIYMHLANVYNCAYMCTTRHASIRRVKSSLFESFVIQTPWYQQLLGEVGSKSKESDLEVENAVFTFWHRLMVQDQTGPFINFKNIQCQICSRSMFTVCSWSNVHFKYGCGAYLTYKEYSVILLFQDHMVLDQ